MNEKHQMKANRNSHLYFQNKKEGFLSRSDIKRIGAGVLLTAGILAGAGMLHRSQVANANPSLVERQATLSFKPGGSNWSASELIAKADGIDPTKPENYAQVGSIEQTLVGEESNNGAEVTPQDKFNVYVEVDKNHLNVSQMSGFGAQLKFTDKK